MKTPRIALVLLCTVSLGALAQKGGDDPDAAARARAAERVSSYEGLNLSEQQRERLTQQLVIEEQRIERDGALRKVGLHPSSLRSLDLDAAQKKDVRAILDGVGKQLMDQFRSAKKGGEKWDYDRWRAYLMTLRTQSNEKIARLLDDDQRAKFAVMNQKHAAAARRGYEKWKDYDKGGKNEKTAKKARKPESAEQEIARLLAAALKALALGSEEQAAIKPALEALIRHKVLGRRALARRRARMAEMAGEEGPARKQLAAYREQRKGYNEKLTTLEDTVRELLTVQQETALVALELLS